MYTLLKYTYPITFRLHMRITSAAFSHTRCMVLAFKSWPLVANCSTRTLTTSCRCLQPRKGDDPGTPTDSDVSESEIDFIKPPDRRGRWNLPTPQFVPPGASRASNRAKAELNLPSNWRKIPKLPKWKKHQLAIREKIGGAQWDPRKKLSPEARVALRAFKDEHPEIKSSEIAKFFGISGESVRRILKSKWQPLTDEEYQKFLLRWQNRRERILDTWVKIGRIPPRKKKEGSESQGEGRRQGVGNSQHDI
ncbi:hypothetical protein POJ06DRAFT_263992 [Lipomyces tetrasporus]|uniref:Required for respiratory growth protein 9, mitochondrial n=1 Tax=Lipomyces tetrasporus TaxID=54092 RepID=A0AAD7VPJ4_9ASCO|nr:uncharacterized protein POJ06DRAFT_263992 [Lipomyces tetrasporus]KAJ8096504.1 hypothetical protein POJ06DRAFT_263992 [Lipomyces tetrasporus]